MTVNAVPFHSQKYWQDRFNNEQHFEWLFTWDTLKPYLGYYLDPKEPILHLGCGNSQLGFDLIEQGYSRVVNVDYADNVITQMKEKTRERVPALQDRLEWYAADCLTDDLSRLGSASSPRDYSVAIDKSLADTIACGDTEDQQNMKRLSQRVLQAIRPNGVWISISFSSSRQYAFDTSGEWTWQTEQALPIKVVQPNDTPNAPDIYYYLYIQRKVLNNPV
ncbi:hypothetical protein BCR43DRAFT_496540 [Syncephalastrum racemosum]|uniref:Uncharacterized protein n=1 Tax=Syncephalastrum racemosum TaxID=13706 RepID=A0A1X2H498_SYNRA|nr:hypothetical protein BCR43DRAFT_496540 [Syncephalastrum racemosum]